MFSIMAKRKEEVCGKESVGIIGYWCDNHRVDKIVAKPEKEPAYISDLMGWFRSLCGHVVSSDKAKASLDYIALMIAMGPANGDGSSAASLWYAPQRWISAAGPMNTITEKLEHLCLYLEELKKSKNAAQRTFAEDLCLPFNNIRFYLVLNGIADILGLFDTLNASLQGFYIDIWRAAKKRELFKEELSDLVMREKASEGKGPSTFIDVATAWWNGKEIPGNTRFAKICRKLELEWMEVPPAEKQNKFSSQKEYKRTCVFKVRFASNNLEDKQHPIPVDVQSVFDIRQQKRTLLCCWRF